MLKEYKNYLRTNNIYEREQQSENLDASMFQRQVSGIVPTGLIGFDDSNKVVMFIVNYIYNEEYNADIYNIVNSLNRLTEIGNYYVLEDYYISFKYSIPYNIIGSFDIDHINSIFNTVINTINRVDQQVKL